MNNRSISVVIPVYNSEETIIEVLNSIINQSENKYLLEVLVVNDGSMDNSKEIINNFIKMYRGSIEIHQISQKNSGVSVARNVGMQKAKGSWIALCDSDDIWLQDKLKHQVSIINNNPNLDILGGFVFDEPFKILFKRFEGTFKPTLNQMLIKSFPWSSTVLMRKEIFDSIGGFEEGRNHGEDMLFYVSVLEDYEFYFDTKKVVDIGFGKNPFGEEGLSSNLTEMHEGTINILDTLKYKDRISTVSYVSFRLFYYLKHLRRVFLTKIHSKKK